MKHSIWKLNLLSKTDISKTAWINSCLYITCFASLSKAFFECYFKLYLCLLDVKPKHFRGVCPLSLHHSSAMDLLGAYSNPRPIATFHVIQVFRAHMIGLLSVLICLNQSRWRWLTFWDQWKIFAELKNRIHYIFHS